MGPPVVTRRWDADAVKQGVADETYAGSGTSRRRSAPRPARGGVPAQGARLEAAGRRRVHRRPAAAQLRDPAGPGRERAPRRTCWPDEPAVAPQHQEGREGRRRGHPRQPRGPARLPRALRDTAERDHFTPRPLSYFRTMFKRAAAPRSRTGSGSTWPATRATWWRPPSGSASAGTRGTPTAPPPPRSVTSAARTRSQWAMIRDAIGEGADVYDLRGITDTLDPEDPHVGLIQFKVGTGGRPSSTPASGICRSRRCCTPRSPSTCAGGADMPRMYVDGDRWRAHLRKIADAHPGLVPVPKGNGYGFGLRRLARQGRLARRGHAGRRDVRRGGRSRLALRRVAARAHALAARRANARRRHKRVVHTVGRLEDLQALADGPASRGWCWSG